MGMSGTERTVNVVVDDGTPLYVSDTLEKAQKVARKLDVAENSDVNLWKNVTCSVETESDQ